MKNILLCLLLVATFTGLDAFASFECQSKLLGEALDSKTYSVSEDRLEASMEEDAKAYALKVLREVRMESGCVTIGSEEDSVICRNVVEDDSSTAVCVIKAEEGQYFIVSDFLGNASAVYTRWD